MAYAKRKIIALLLITLMAVSVLGAVSITTATRAQAIEKTEVRILLGDPAEVGTPMDIRIYVAAGINNVVTGKVQVYCVEPGAVSRTDIATGDLNQGSFNTQYTPQTAGGLAVTVDYLGTQEFYKQSATQYTTIHPSAGTPIAPKAGSTATPPTEITPTASGDASAKTGDGGGILESLPYIPYINEGGASSNNTGGSSVAGLSLPKWLWIPIIVVIILVIFIVIVAAVGSRSSDDEEDDDDRRYQERERRRY